MGVCESANNEKKGNVKNKDEEDDEKLNYSEVSDFKIDQEDENKLKTSNKKEFQKSLNKKNNSIKCPKLDKYERSIAKKSEASVIDYTKSEVSSKVEEEIIIKGEINKECPNQEKDFNNKSFMKLVKNNGGIILSEEGQSTNGQSVNIRDKHKIGSEIGKDNLSEIKSQISFPTNPKSLNSVFSIINGKSTKNDLKSELNKAKDINSSFSRNTLNPVKDLRNDKQSHYSTKTIKPKINLNKYINGAFNTNANFVINNNYQNRNYNLLPLNTAILVNQADNYHMINKPHEKDSLISHYNSKTNDSSNTDLMGSFISIPKNDERIPESELNFGENGQDIISNLS